MVVNGIITEWSEAVSQVTPNKTDRQQHKSDFNEHEAEYKNTCLKSPQYYVKQTGREFKFHINLQSISTYQSLFMKKMFPCLNLTVKAL